MDLTLIGVPYFNRLRPKAAMPAEHDSDFANLTRQVRMALDAVPYQPYRQHRPLTLVLPESPLLDWQSRAHVAANLVGIGDGA